MGDEVLLHGSHLEVAVFISLDYKMLGAGSSFPEQFCPCFASHVNSAVFPIQTAISMLQ